MAMHEDMYIIKTLKFWSIVAVSGCFAVRGLLELYEDLRKKVHPETKIQSLYARPDDDGKSGEVL